MKFNIVFLTLLFFSAFFGSKAQVSVAPPAEMKSGPKTLYAGRISAVPKINGVLDEPFWSGLTAAENFVVYSPYNGSKPGQQTVVRIAYDDDALYVGAVMYDSHPDSICREMGKRDQVEALITDYISIDLLPYNDGLNMYEFKITPANLQNDCKYSAVGQDLNWDAVWESATCINDSSWVAEVRIPYSALRFPNQEIQKWGINLWRNLMRRREWSTWTFVDNKDQDIFKYYGTLEGIKNIAPPLRLSFTPYLAGYTEKNPELKSWKQSFRGGMDLRWGINQSYTLDMMLIPDFGQVQSDDQVLNLSPFEIRYDEKRQFFSEGTELFNKCGIFYSRRIGSTPRDYYKPYFEALSNDEAVLKNPTETRIINATKISGRNTKGLGIGFFNAMTSPANAELADSALSSRRYVKTQPFTNYNVLVLDQNLRNNSYASIINTNYFIPESRYLANVTGTETRLNSRSGKLAFFGRFNYSRVDNPETEAKDGYLYLLSLSKPRGKFQYELNRSVMNSTYNPNDMGYVSNNNEVQNTLRITHLQNDPYWKLQSIQSDLVFAGNSLFSEKELIMMKIQADNLTTFRNYWSNYLMAEFYPDGYSDFYEPRNWGWKYVKPSFWNFNWRIASDARKKLRLHNSVGILNSKDNANFMWFLETTARMRFSNRFTVSLLVSYTKNRNDYGWVNTVYDSVSNPVIYFGRRDVTTFSNIINARYIFNTKASLNLRARHYWSKAGYDEFFRLKENGELARSDYNQNADLSFNAFTADIQFIWYFAPGSELSLVWKNYINTVDDHIRLNYLEDLGNTMQSPQTNSFSVRMIYYLDYRNLRKVLSSSGRI